MPLTPLLEGPDVEMQEYYEGNKKESSWEIIREWFKIQKSSVSPEGGSGRFSSPSSSSNSLAFGNGGNGGYYVSPAKRHDLRLLLGVLGCPLAPIPSLNFKNVKPDHNHMIKDNIPWVSIYFLRKQRLYSFTYWVCLVWFNFSIDLRDEIFFYFFFAGDVNSILHNPAILGCIRVFKIIEKWGEKEEHVCGRGSEDDML